MTPDERLILDKAKQTLDAAQLTRGLNLFIRL
jgi:hypothetical protein